MKVTVFWSSPTGWGHKTFRVVVQAAKYAADRLGPEPIEHRDFATSADEGTVVRVRGVTVHNLLKNVPRETDAPAQP